MQTVTDGKMSQRVDENSCVVAVYNWLKNGLGNNGTNPMVGAVIVHTI
jgi:hypothetical protein